jgi:hypothetical protein
MLPLAFYCNNFHNLQNTPLNTEFWKFKHHSLFVEEICSLVFQTQHSGNLECVMDWWLEKHAWITVYVHMDYKLDHAVYHKKSVICH